MIVCVTCGWPLWCLRFVCRMSLEPPLPSVTRLSECQRHMMLRVMQEIHSVSQNVRFARCARESTEYLKMEIKQRTAAGDDQVGLGGKRDVVRRTRESSTSTCVGRPSRGRCTSSPAPSARSQVPSPIAIFPLGGAQPSLDTSLFSCFFFAVNVVVCLDFPASFFLVLV